MPVGQRRAAGSRGGPRGRGRMLADGGLDVLFGDPAVRAGARRRGAGRRPTRGPAAAWPGRRAASCRQPAFRLRLPAGWLGVRPAWLWPRLRLGRLRASRRRLRRGVRRSSSASAASASAARRPWRRAWPFGRLGGGFGGGRPRALWLRRRPTAAASIDGQQRIADFDLRALVDVNLVIRPASGQGSSTTALPVSISITLWFGLDLVPFVDQHVDDVARLDVLAQVRHFEINRHGSSTPWLVCSWPQLRRRSAVASPARSFDVHAMAVTAQSRRSADRSFPDRCPDP